AEARDDRIDYFEQVLGIEPVGERGEAGDVGEQSGDEAALFWQLVARLDEDVCDLFGDEATEGVGDVSLGFLRGLRHLAPGCAAVSAEAGGRKVLAAAVGASPRRVGWGAAVPAEAHPFRVFGSTTSAG